MPSTTTTRVAVDEKEERILRGQFTYTACYCEENAYLLAKKLACNGMADLSSLFVVFISNAERKVPIWHQRHSSSEDGMVIWDYHVICLQAPLQEGTEALVWDFDTALPFPVSFSKYMREAFRSWLILESSYQRLYRVVTAPLFIKYFASDRRHMRTPEGLWKMHPPEYDCISAEDGSVHNLEDYVTMSEVDVLPGGTSARESLKERLGVLFNETSFESFFRCVEM